MVGVILNTDICTGLYQRSHNCAAAELGSQMESCHLREKWCKPQLKSLCLTSVLDDPWISYWQVRESTDMVSSCLLPNTSAPWPVTMDFVTEVCYLALDKEAMEEQAVLEGVITVLELGLDRGEEDV